MIRVEPLLADAKALERELAGLGLKGGAELFSYGSSRAPGMNMVVADWKIADLLLLARRLVEVLES